MLISLETLHSQGFKIEKDTVHACNGIGLQNLLQAGQQWLEAHVDVVNALNVFPVPDGDTGTNMVLTMRAALEGIEQAPDHWAGTIAAAAARGALLGARGNSGVILSQYIDGLARGLAGKQVFTVDEFAHATKLAAQQAYQSVIEPVEGTILTVANAVAEADSALAKHTQDLATYFLEIVAAAKAAQARTPELLPVLKEAGVTDSGGQGLVYILEGGLRLMQGQPLAITSKNSVAAPALRAKLEVSHPEYGYDVQFLIIGQQLNAAAIRSQIDQLGWSTVVAGESQTVKVHLHTHDPGPPLSYGAALGRLEDVVVENMDAQARAFEQQQSIPADRVGLKNKADIATVSVVAGTGMADIFTSLGVDGLVWGGQSMNPSPQDILAAIAKIEADNVLILPNNGNIILAAQQVQTLTDKQIVVVPTKTMPQGIAALLAFNRQDNLVANAQRMEQMAGQPITIELTQAVRNSSVNGLGIQAGQVIGVVDGVLACAGTAFDVVALEALAGLPDMENYEESYELVTIYTGEESSPVTANMLADKIIDRYPALEVETHSGGQPLYDYIISVE